MASKSRVGELLLKARVIDELQLRSARARLDQWGGRIGKVITDMGLADEDTITATIAKAMGLQQVQLGHLPRDPTALARLDVRFAEEHAVFPMALKDNGKTLVLAMADPTDLELMDAVASRARTRISPVVAGETEIEHAILRYYRNQDPAAGAAPRARQAIRRATQEVEPAGADDGEEFKIVDMSGKTMIKHLAELEGGPTDPAGMPPLAARPGPPVPSSRTSDLLDEMMAPAASAALTAEERTRLESLRVNQEKSGVIVRALAALLVEKGYATAKDVATRLKL
ncbi:MAG: general secretion pathway protein GspE [Myxococcota bacterium]|nr:general secretion pathway protein GspE [Myxococcota bacterium]